MNILFSITYYSPYVSGLTIYVKRMAEALAKRGHEVTIICMRHDVKLAKTEIINGVKVVRIKPDLSVSKGYLSHRWLIECWRLVNRCDAVIINLPQFEGLIPAKFGWLLGKKVVSVYHCEVSLPSGLINKVVQLFLEISNSLTLFLSQTIITYTEDFGQHSRILKPFLGKTTYIYPPVVKPPVDFKVKAKLDKSIGPRGITIGISARLAREKGIEYLIQAIPEISKSLKPRTFKIAVAGPINPVGEADYSRYILDLAEKYHDSIVFLGSLSQAEIGAFYSLLDVLVLPSINSTEAFGMVQVEAMLHGVPVVASNLPGVRIPVQKIGLGEIVPPKDSCAIAKAIGEILSNSKKFVLQNGKAESVFNSDAMVTVFEKLLR